MTDVWDYLLAPVYMFVLYQMALFYQRKKVGEHPEYNYYALGMLAKMLGGIILCLIYTQYYVGGDTNAYHNSSLALKRLFFEHPSAYFRILFGYHKPEDYYYFNAKTGFPFYWADKQSYSVVRYSSIFHFFSFERYFVATVLLAAFSYMGIWKLYRLFCYYFPLLYKRFAVAILFMPSVLFWGSGILKDTYTLTAACWFLHFFHKALILRKRVWISLLWGAFAASIMLRIKPYVALALVPGSVYWASFSSVRKIQNAFFRFILGPFALVLLGTIFVGIFQGIKGQLGAYSSLQGILDKAVVTQRDLKQEYYGGNSFDIGEFEATLPGVLSKLPIATFTGLFRPMLVEVKNPMMLLAALENTLLLFFTLRFLIKVGLIGAYRIVVGEPLVFFCLMYSFLFSFSVGLSTANFGALVRYKIPAVPFFLAGMFVAEHLARNLTRTASKPQASALSKPG